MPILAYSAVATTTTTFTLVVVTDTVGRRIIKIRNLSIYYKGNPNAYSLLAHLDTF